MKPLIKYRGGKSKEITCIEKHVSDFSGRYIEPFFGGGALFFYMELKRAIINNINSNVITFYIREACKKVFGCTNTGIEMVW